MGNCLTKAEVLDWIDLLYTDLSKDNLLIGGYYFTFEHLVDFFIMQQTLEEHKRKIQEKIDKLLDKTGKAANKAAEAAINKLYSDMNDVRIELDCKTKNGQKAVVPCTEEEFITVFNTILEFKKDLEYFKQYCNEEAEKISKEEIPSFMWFINDLVEDMRDRFQGRIE